EDPGDVLRYNLDRRKFPIEVSFHRDVKALILCSGAVISEVERLFDERVDVGRLPIATAAARMRQHALDDTVGAAAVLSDLLEIAGQHSDDFVELSADIVAE